MIRKILYILVLGTTLGCATYERCSQKYGSQSRTDTTFVVREKVVPVEIMMPADTIETIVDCSNIYRHLQIETSRRGFLQTEVVPQETLVRVRTSIIPMYIHDTLRMADTITIVKESMTLSQSNAAWKAAAIAFGTLILMAIIGLVVISKITSKR